MLKPGDRIYVRRLGDGDGRVSRRDLSDSSYARQARRRRARGKASKYLRYCARKRNHAGINK
jgi:hypothetical protein